MVQHAATLVGGIAGGWGNLALRLGIVGILLHRGGDLMHRRRRFLDGRRLAFGALGKVLAAGRDFGGRLADGPRALVQLRSEEHTSELQSLMRISYAVFCLKKQINNTMN